MRKRVLVGLSGGVDSAVAAALLIERGCQVVGATLILYDQPSPDSDIASKSCCSPDLVDNARAVCKKLGIAHYVVDLRKTFEKKVVDDFVNCYVCGRTPNPCVNCNRHIKWGEMLRIADELDCTYIATGHYARLDRSFGAIRLLRGISAEKDQSYVLWGVKLDALERTLFPLGQLRKAKVREMAKVLGLPNARYPESQEVCFVHGNSYADLVRSKRTDDDPSLQRGSIFDNRGRKIGEHKGYAHYTIGQRRGLGVSSPTPLYVTKIDSEKRSITVGSKDDLLGQEFSVSDMNLLVLAERFPKMPRTKIRYRHAGEVAHMNFTNGGARVRFENPQRAITPGQSAVFYAGDQVVGGGIIDQVFA